MGMLQIQQQLITVSAAQNSVPLHRQFLPEHFLRMSAQTSLLCYQQTAALPFRLDLKGRYEGLQKIRLSP
jgi:hypothetical protein